MDCRAARATNFARRPLAVVRGRLLTRWRRKSVAPRGVYVVQVVADMTPRLVPVELARDTTRERIALDAAFALRFLRAELRAARAVAVEAVEQKACLLACVRVWFVCRAGGSRRVSRRVSNRGFAATP